jgi:hypothetical protein
MARGSIANSRPRVASAQAAYMQDFLETVRTVSFNRFPGLIPLSIKAR